MSTAEIVKVQLSITTNLAGPQVLIYNEDRSIMYQGPAYGDLLDFPPKSFWKAELIGTHLELHKQVSDQDW